MVRGENPTRGTEESRFPKLRRRPPVDGYRPPRREDLGADFALEDGYPKSQRDPSPSGTGDGSSGVRDTAATTTTVVATHGANTLEGLSVEKIRLFIAKAEPECSRNPSTDWWQQFIPKEFWLKFKLYLLAARGPPSGLSQFTDLETMDWLTFVRFLRCFMKDFGSFKEITS